MFHGHFLDLRTLAFALTDRAYSLKSACDAFGVTHGKQTASAHGRVTPAYIDYNEETCSQRKNSRRSFSTSTTLRRTVGLLQRRHIRVAALKYIGKESNKLEDVESGLVHATDSVYTQYPDPRHDEWRAVTEALKEVSLNRFEQLTGRSRRMLIDARERRRVPHQRNRLLLAAVARKVGALK